MARRFTTGFETGELNEHNGANTTSFWTIDSSQKRTGNYSWRLPGQGLAGHWFSHVLSDDPSEIYVRYAYRHQVGLYAGTTTPCINWAMLGSDGVCHVSCGVDQVSCSPVLYRGGNGIAYNLLGATPIATASYTLGDQRWYMIEAQIKVDNSAGTVVVKVNNTTVLTYTGDTASGATTGIRSVQFGSDPPGSGLGFQYVWLDDIAVNDTAGNYENTWPGLGGVFLLKPNADGATTTWDTSTGTVHYELVDDVPANTTDWIQALDTGEIDLFELENAPTYVNQINLVEVLYQAAVTESGYNIMTDVLRHGTVNYTDGTSTVVSIAPAYSMYKGTAYYRQPQDGTTAWGTVEVNALQAGVQIL